MSTIAFMVALMVTVLITNKKNDAKDGDDFEFERSDSLVIFVCFLSSILANMLSQFFSRFLVFGISCGVYGMVLTIVNIHREAKIKKKHDQILMVFRALTDIFGQPDLENMDFSNIPFELEEDHKLKTVSKIVINTSTPGARINDNSIIYAQYSINKVFPDLQWTSSLDMPNQQLTYQGLPKPPKVAKWHGSDYRPTGFIPLGLATESEEVGWNLSDPKDLGESSYIGDNGVVPEALLMPSAPQAMCLGSTGGGKAIFVGQEVEIITGQ